MMDINKQIHLNEEFKAIKAIRLINISTKFHMAYILYTDTCLIH